MGGSQRQGWRVGGTAAGGQKVQTSSYEDVMCNMGDYG